MVQLRTLLQLVRNSRLPATLHLVHNRHRLRLPPAAYSDHSRMLEPQHCMDRWDAHNSLPRTDRFLLVSPMAGRLLLMSARLEAALHNTLLEAGHHSILLADIRPVEDSRSQPEDSQVQVDIREQVDNLEEPHNILAADNSPGADRHRVVGHLVAWPAEPVKLSFCESASLQLFGSGRPSQFHP